LKLGNAVSDRSIASDESGFDQSFMNPFGRFVLFVRGLYYKVLVFRVLAPRAGYPCAGFELYTVVFRAGEIKPPLLLSLNFNTNFAWF